MDAAAIVRIGVAARDGRNGPVESLVAGHVLDADPPVIHTHRFAADFECGAVREAAHVNRAGPCPGCARAVGRVVLVVQWHDLQVEIAGQSFAVLPLRGSFGWPMIVLHAAVVDLDVRGRRGYDRDLVGAVGGFLAVHAFHRHVEDLPAFGGAAGVLRFHVERLGHAFDHARGDRERAGAGVAFRGDLFAGRAEAAARRRFQVGCVRRVEADLHLAFACGGEVEAHLVFDGVTGGDDTVGRRVVAGRETVLRVDERLCVGAVSGAVRYFGDPGVRVGRFGGLLLRAVGGACGQSGEQDGRRGQSRRRSGTDGTMRGACHVLPFSSWCSFRVFSLPVG